MVVDVNHMLLLDGIATVDGPYAPDVPDCRE
jgi:hypothetical protein